MDIFFQLIDVDYVMVGGKVVVRIFGKCEDGKTVTFFVNNYNPYFYIQSLEKDEIVENFLEKYNNEIIKIEPVMKFLPHCYMKEKTKIIKITCKDPSNIPIIRDDLWKEGIVKKIFEADILFKYRFMADKGLNGSRWYKANGTPITTSTVKTNRSFNLLEIKETEEKNSNFKTLSLDIEVVSTEGLPKAEISPIIMISLAFSPNFNNKKSLVLVAKPIKNINDSQGFINEKEMLEEFLEILQKYDPDIAVGYNSNNFDIPYILDRLKQNNIKQILGRNDKQSYYRTIIGSTKSSIPGRILVDDYVMIKEMQIKTQLAEKGFPKLKRYGLNDVSLALLGEGKHDIHYKDIPKLWEGSSEDVMKLVDYARQDSILALRLLLEKNLLDKFFELSKVSGLLMQDILDGGEATRIENILLKEFNKKEFLLPLKPNSNEMNKRLIEKDELGFKGALVLEPNTGLHTTPIVYLDFKSMYPTIFISFNICPTTLITKESSYTGENIKTPLGSKFVPNSIRFGIIPKIVQHLINERDRIRTEANKTTDVNLKKILESKQIAVKYMTNAFYGYTGYIRAKTYNLHVATAITGIGRTLIEKTRDTVNNIENMKVVYGDTDSVMVKISKAKSPEEAFKIGQDLEKKINKVLENKITIKIENVFKTLLILSKKRYAGISVEPNPNGIWKEKTVMKGIETVRRDWCDLTGSTLNRVLDIILREQNPKKALNYVKEIISDLDNNKIPLEKLVITKSISKSLKQYKGIMPHVEVMKKMQKRDISTAPSIGDRVPYVIISGSQLTSKRAEDPDYVKENGLKIDSKYYKENQLAPPLERVFESLGITKTDILIPDQKNMLSFTKKPEKQNILENMDGVICDSCSETFRRPPISGKCDSCSGKLSFYSGEIKSKSAII